MRDQTILFFLLLVIAVLAFVILYQRFVFRRGIQIQLIQISRKLEDIAESDSDEKVMVFTDESALMELEGEINCLLLDRQKIKVISSSLWQSLRQAITISPFPGST